jgi:hypothetical protein
LGVFGIRKSVWLLCLFPHSCSLCVFSV